MNAFKARMTFYIFVAVMVVLPLAALRLPRAPVQVQYPTTPGLISEPQGKRDTATYTATPAPSYAPLARPSLPYQPPALASSDDVWQRLHQSMERQQQYDDHEMRNRQQMQLSQQQREIDQLRQQQQQLQRDNDQLRFDLDYPRSPYGR